MENLSYLCLDVLKILFFIVTVEACLPYKHFHFPPPLQQANCLPFSIIADSYLITVTKTYKNITGSHNSVKLRFLGRLSYERGLSQPETTLNSPPPSQTCIIRLITEQGWLLPVLLHLERQRSPNVVLYSSPKGDVT